MGATIVRVGQTLFGPRPANFKLLKKQLLLQAQKEDEEEERAEKEKAEKEKQ